MMRNRCGHNAWGSLRQCLVIRERFFSTATRVNNVDIRPLMKKIHPDLFATQSAEVQQTNLKCLQTIQELNAQIQYTTELLSKHQNQNQNQQDLAISFLRTFNPVYRLSCYVYSSTQSSASETKVPKDSVPEDESEGENSKNDSILTYVSMNILTPPPLRRNQIQDLETFHSSLRAFLTSHSSFWVQLNLSYPYEEYVSAASKTKDKDSSSTEDTFFQEFNVKKEDFQHELYAAALRNKMYANSSANNPILSQSPATVKEYARYGRSLTYKQQLQHRKQEIDFFFQQKHVRLANVSIEQELAVVEKFRNFLLDFGDTLNFSFVDWKHVYFVLHYSIKSTSTTANTFEMREVTTKKAPAVIIKVPVNFRERKLLDYLHENLSCTQLRF